MINEPRVIAPSVEGLVQHAVRALFRRYHLNRDWIIGLVGERGSGKSLTGANIAIRDFMMNGEPCWSNMNMRLGVKVEDEAAQANGLAAGGEAVYEAEHIDKQAFLALDGRYEGGVLFFDEFNLEYGEARRSVANVNLMTDRAIQQLRKLQCGLVYTVLNEMYVDVRIRENTDMFIKCSDIAYKPNNLLEQMEQGVVFEWMVYPMSPRVAGTGQTYNETSKPVGPIRAQLKHMWESIDTLERQAAGKTSYTDKKETLVPVELGEDPIVVQERDKWGWLDKRLTEFFAKHTDDGETLELTTREFAHELGVPYEEWPSVVKQVYKRLPGMDFQQGRGRRRPGRYFVPNAVLPR
jgi:hypothetical protein